MKYWKIAGIALVVIMAASLLTGTLVFAQGDDPVDDDAVERPLPGIGVLRDRFIDGMRGGRTRHDGLLDGGTRDGMLEAVAEALGVDIQAELDAGKRLPEIIDELGIEPAELAEAFATARTAMIEGAVADGTITQEQADQMLERAAQAAERAEAQTALRTYQIEQALANGAITQEQADLLTEAGAPGGPKGRFGGRGFGPTGPGMPFGSE